MHIFKHIFPAKDSGNRLIHDLREAKMQLLEQLKAAEYHHAMAEMLIKRIARLNKQIEEK